MRNGPGTRRSFKWGFNLLDEIDTIAAKTPAEHAQILVIFKKHGWDATKPLPDGRQIADMVKLNQ